MTNDCIKTSVRILDKTYQVKCPPAEVGSLEKAAEQLDDKLRALRNESCAFSLASAAVITSLNLLHELLLLKSQHDLDQEGLHQWLTGLQGKIDNALANQEELLLEPRVL